MSFIEFSGLSVNLFDVIDTTIPAILIFIAGLLIIIGMILFHIRHKRFKSATIKFSDVRIVRRAVRSLRQKYRFLLTVLRVAAVAMFVMAFARPRSSGFSVLDTGFPNTSPATRACRSSPRSKASANTGSPLISARMRSSQAA